MTESASRRVVLLEDSPASIDKFGAHSRVSNAIAELIVSEAPGGKVIGLEGGWGTGKTTVTCLLKESLSDSPEHGFVVFDTWAHEGDPLRRTFLEDMINSLVGLKWANEKVWSVKLDEIARRRKETTKKTVPKPTRLGKFFAISLLLVPFGSAILGDALRDGAEFTIDRGRPFSVQLIFATLLTLSWLLVLTLNGLRVLRMDAEEREAGDPWNFIFSKSTTEETTSTVEASEPTSVEFDRYFSDLLSESLGGRKQRRLTIVLDNLDRVNVDHGLSLWATLQTFLQERSQADRGWFSQLWILVPYDPLALSRLWESGEEGRQEVSVSFMEKVFALRFRVPQLLLADWRSFLLDQAGLAFPDHTGAERRSLLSIFEIYLAQSSEKVATPRSMKVYLNQVGTLARQWGDTFPLGHMAYYVTISETELDITNRLRDGSLPAQEYQHALGESSSRDVAALHFNVDADSGQQLLLGEPVSTALASSDGEALKSLANIHGPQIYPVIGHSVATILTGEGGRANCRAAHAINVAELDLADPDLGTAVGLISKGILAETSWGLLDLECTQGVGALVSILNEEDQSRAIVSSVADHALKVFNEADGSPSEHALAWLGLLRVCATLGHEAASKVTITVPCDGAGWTAACTSLHERDPAAEFLPAFVPSLAPSEIATYFSEVVEASEFEADDLIAIRVSSALSEPPVWDSLLAEIRGRLAATVAAPAMEAEHLLEALIYLRHHGVVENAARAKAFNEGGHFLHHYHHAQAANNDRMRALSLHLYLLAKPSAAAPPAAGDSRTGHVAMMSTLADGSDSILSELEEVTVAFSTLDHLLEVYEARGDWDELLKALLLRIARREDAENFFRPSELCGNWKFLGEVFEDDRDQALALVSKADREGALSGSVANEEFAGDAITLACFILWHGSPGDAFIEWCTNGLESLDRDVWIAGLTGETYGALLLLAMINKGHAVKLKAQYADAHAALAEKVISGTITELGFIEHWPKLLKPLGSHGVRKGLRSNLLQFARNADGDLPELFFSAYGPELEGMTALATVDTVNQLFAPIVNAKSAEGLAWLDSVLQSRSKVKATCSDKAKSEMLHSRITDALRDEEQIEGFHSLLLSVAGTLGIEKEEDKAVADQDDEK